MQPWFQRCLCNQLSTCTLVVLILKSAICLSRLRFLSAMQSACHTFSVLAKSWNLVEDVSIADRTGADWWDLCSGRSQFTPRRPCFALMWVFKRLLMPYSHKQSTNTALWGLGTLAMQLRTGNSQKTKLETFKQTETQSAKSHLFPVQVFCPSS